MNSNYFLFLLSHETAFQARSWKKYKRVLDRLVMPTTPNVIDNCRVIVYTISPFAIITNIRKVMALAIDLTESSVILILLPIYL